MRAIQEGTTERAIARQANSRPCTPPPPPDSGGFEAECPLDLRRTIRRATPVIDRIVADLDVARAVEGHATIPSPPPPAPDEDEPTEVRRGACIRCEIIPGASPLGGRLDSDGHCEACSIAAIVESSRGARMPRTMVALKAASLADRCRTAAACLDAATGDAGSVEPGTLRRRVDGIVRALVAELSGQVTT